MDSKLYFSDPRCDFEKGRIQVQTEFPFYEPGDQVNGKVFIKVPEKLLATHITIEFKGQEKAAFTRFYTDQDGEKQERVKA